MLNFLDKVKHPRISFDTIIMQGGMDTITPLHQLPNGMVRDSLNFESSLLGGYSRIAGYERSDGQALPSSKIYSTIYIDSFVNVPAVGNTVTGQTSGATGYVLAAGPNYIVFSEGTLAFVTPEVIKVGATLIGNTVVSTGGISSLQAATYVGLAADRQRTHLAAVPGSGSIRGVFVYNDVVYAFRDNAGGTATVLYKQTAGGWSLVSFFYELAFTAGTTQPAEGTTITQGGVTAVLKRVLTSSGSWSYGDAAGTFIIAAPAGGNFAAGAATDGACTFTLSGIQTAISFTVGGTFEFVIGNFSGQGSTTRVYGCDGTNRCFEFDGTVLAPISTGFTPDTPKHIQIHKNFLFISVLASLGFSAPGLPYNWTALSGAGVIATGDTITNMLELPGAQTTAAMGVWTRDTTYILYGTGASSWNPVPLNTGCGGLHYTAENMAHTYVMDDRGVIDMQETLNYGNFEIDTITYRVNAFIESKRSLVVGSVLNRHKSQYRLFFSDGTGLYITNIHGQMSYQNVFSGCMPIRFPNPVTCVYESKLSTGDEVTYFGSTNGMVYKMEGGTSFDGATIEAHLVFGYNNAGAARFLKAFRHAQIEASSSAYFQFDFGYSLGYGTALLSQPNYKTYQNDIIIPYWDSFTWDSFVWDGSSVIPPEVEMEGTAENYALMIKSSSAILNAFSINSAIIHYSLRREVR